MLGRVSVKKSSFWGANLNLHRGKTVKVFYTFSSLHDNHGQDLSNKKNQSSLSCLCPEICCGKNTIFLKKRVILWAPTVYVTYMSLATVCVLRSWWSKFPMAELTHYIYCIGTGVHTTCEGNREASTRRQFGSNYPWTSQDILLYPCVKKLTKLQRTAMPPCLLPWKVYCERFHSIH